MSHSTLSTGYFSFHLQIVCHPSCLKAAKKAGLQLIMRPALSFFLLHRHLQELFSELLRDGQEGGEKRRRMNARLSDVDVL